MATSAVARDIVLSLRQQIARIEGTLPERLEAPAVGAGPASGPAADAGLLVRREDARGEAFLSTGLDGLDTALGGGLDMAALTEFHGGQTRDAASVSGFALCLTSLLLKRMPSAAQRFLLWIGTAEIFREAGMPYAWGLLQAFGIRPEQLLLAQAPKPADALWIAEEASLVTDFAAVIVELRGCPRVLDLTATRRLHRRARATGHPVFLLRQGALEEPTAAPVRLVLSPAPAGLRETVEGPLAASIGPPAFTVQVSKSRSAMAGRFVLEWNADERIFEDRAGGRRTTPDRRLVVSHPADRPHSPAAKGTVVAFAAGAASAARAEPPGEQHAHPLRARRAG